MQTVKRELPMFSFYHYTSIQRHLEKRAREGWRLMKAEKGRWLYRRMEPKELRYAVVYFPDSSQFDPGPTEGQQTLQDYCLAAGWEPVADWGQMQIYCTADPDALPIETEPSVQLDTIRRTMKRNFLPGTVSLLAVFLLQMGLQFSSFRRSPAEYLSSTANLPLLLLILLGFAVDLIELGGYAVWVRRSKRSIAQGGGCLPALGHPRRTAALLVLMGLAVLLQLASMANTAMIGFTLLHLAGMAGIIYVTWRIQSTMKQKKFSRRVNRAVTMGATVVLSILLTVAFTVGLFMTLRSGIGRRPSAETYEAYGQTWDVYHDELPLSIEDLTDVDSSFYSKELTVQSSPLLTRWEATQDARLDGPEGLPDMEYEIVFFKVPALYGLVENGFLREVDRYNENISEEYLAEHGDSYRTADAAPWGADRVYQRYSGDRPENYFLLCWEDRIVKIHFYWAPTPSQMAIAGETLKQA